MTSAKEYQENTVDVEAPCLVTENSQHLLSEFTEVQYDLCGNDFHTCRANEEKMPDEQVYKLLQETLKSQRMLLYLKRTMIILGGLMVLLCLSAFTTAWAAEMLANKDWHRGSGNLHRALEMSEKEQDKHSQRSLSSDEASFQTWTKELLSKYEVCGGTCHTYNISESMTISFPYVESENTNMHLWLCEIGNPFEVAPVSFMNEIKGNSFVEQQKYGVQNYEKALGLISSGGLPSVMLSDGINDASKLGSGSALLDLMVFCNAHVPLDIVQSAANIDWRPYNCPDFANNIRLNIKGECTGCERGVSSASSAGELIAEISSCPVQEPWLSFDNSASEKACYDAIANYVSNYKKNDLRSYYYTDMKDATTTWKDKVFGMSPNLMNILARGACNSQDFYRIKIQLTNELTVLTDLKNWKDSMLDFISETNTKLGNDLDGFKGIVELEPTNVLPPPGLSPWIEVFLGVLELTSAAAPSVLSDELAIQVMKGTGVLLTNMKPYLEKSGGGNSSPDDNSNVAVAYDYLKNHALPDSFAAMTNKIMAEIKPIAEDYGKLLAFNSTVSAKYNAPENIVYTDLMAAKGFEDIFKFQAFSMLFPVKYGMCYQTNEQGSAFEGSCDSWYVPDNMKISIGDDYFWPCEHSHPNLVPPAEVLHYLKGNSYADQKGLGLHGSIAGMPQLLLSDGSKDAGAAIAGMALHCNSAAPSDDDSAFFIFGYTTNCAEFAKSMTFSDLGECSPLHENVGPLQ